MTIPRPSSDAATTARAMLNSDLWFPRAEWQAVIRDLLATIDATPPQDRCPSKGANGLTSCRHPAGHTGNHESDPEDWIRSTWPNDPTPPTPLHDATGTRWEAEAWASDHR